MALRPSLDDRTAPIYCDQLAARMAVTGAGSGVLEVIDMVSRTARNRTIWIVVAFVVVAVVVALILTAGDGGGGY